MSSAPHRKGRRRARFAGAGCGAAFALLLAPAPAQAQAQTPAMADGPFLSVTGTSDGGKVLRGWLGLPLAEPGAGRLSLQLEGAAALDGGGGSGQAGLLYRHPLGTALELGGYGFAAWDRSPAGSDFVTLAPGLDLLGPRWQLSWNLYLPLGDRTRATGPEAWAGESGDLQYTSFAGHTQYDRRIAPVDEVGAGTDLAASAVLGRARDLRLTLGGYWFDQSETRAGGVAGLQAEIAPGLTAGFGYRYDSEEGSRVGLTFGFRFGGAAGGRAAGPAPAAGWRDRPVQHDIAALGEANTIPIGQRILPVSDPLPYRDNIWFFAPAGGSFDAAAGTANCSYERPCTRLDGEVTLAIALAGLEAGYGDAPALYLASGRYSMPVGSVLPLFANQSLVGRRPGYAAAATGADRPVLETGAVSVLGGNLNTANGIENLVLRNNGSAFRAGLYAVDAGDLRVGNSSIGSPDPADRDALFLHAVEAFGATRLQVGGSTIAAGNGGDAAASPAVGIYLDGADSLSLTDSRVAATASGDGNAGAIALLHTGGPVAATIAGSSLAADVGGRGAGTAYGILASSAPGMSYGIDGSSLAARAEGDGNGGARALELSGFGGGAIAFGNGAISAVSHGENGFGAVAVLDSSLAGSGLRFERARLDSRATGSGNSAASFVAGGGTVAAIAGSVLTARHESAGDSGFVNQVQLFGNAQLTVTDSLVEGYDISTGGTAAVNNFRVHDAARLLVQDSRIVNDGRSAGQSGNTNITAFDAGAAAVTGSTLVSAFSGGPPVTEPSGAVPLWTLGRSTIGVQDSRIVARAGNASTSPLPIEAEGAGTVTVSGSTLESIQPNGNMLAVSLQAIVAADESRVALSGTTAHLRLSGPSLTGISLATAQGRASIGTAGGVLAADNRGIQAGPAPLLTVGATAFQDSAIVLRGSSILLSGGTPVAARSFQNGSVAIAE